MSHASLRETSEEVKTIRLEQGKNIAILGKLAGDGNYSPGSNTVRRWSIQKKENFLVELRIKMKDKKEECLCIRPVFIRGSWGSFK